MNWETVSLGDLIEIKHGYAFDGQFFSDSGKYVLLTPGNCHERGGLKLRGDREKYYVGEFPSEFLLHSGDLLIVMTDLVNTAPILGGAFLIPEEDRYLHNQRLGLVEICAPSRIDKQFLFYLLNSHSYRSQVRGSASGATVRHTSPSRIRKCTLRIPKDPLDQARVAQVLSAYDDLIENNRRRIALLERAARLLYEQWFVRFCFPGHEHAKFIDGLPEGWGELHLQQVCDGEDGIQTGPFGSQLHQSDYSEFGVPVVMPKDLVSFRIVTDGIARVPEQIAQRLSRHRMIEGDTVYGRRGDIGRRAFVSERQVGWLCGTGCLRIRPNDQKINPRFLFDALGAPKTAGTIANRAKGATLPNLNSTILRSVPVIVPPRPIQELYAAQVHPIASQIEALSAYSDKLAEARDLLLPRLMSGEVEV